MNCAPFSGVVALLAAAVTACADTAPHARTNAGCRESYAAPDYRGAIESSRPLLRRRRMAYARRA